MYLAAQEQYKNDITFLRSYKNFYNKILFIVQMKYTLVFLGENGYFPLRAKEMNKNGDKTDI